MDEDDNGKFRIERVNTLYSNENILVICQNYHNYTHDDDSCTAQQILDVAPLLFRCRTIVGDGGPRLKQHLMNVSCLLGRILLFI